MKINIIGGRIASFNEGNHVGASTEDMQNAVTAMLHCPAMPSPHFTGYLDTEARTWRPVIKTMSADEVVAKAAIENGAAYGESWGHATAPIQRYSATFGPNGSFMVPDPNGGYVLLADYRAQVKSDGERIRVLTEAKERLDHALDTAHKADAEKRQAITRTMKLGQWIYTWSELIERIADLVKENKRNEDVLTEWRNTYTEWRSHIAAALWVLDPKQQAVATLGTVLDTISERNNRMHFAEDFRKQVLNLLGVHEGTETDAVYHAIQSLVVTSKDSRLDKLRGEIDKLMSDLTTANQSIAARQEELELWRTELAAALNVEADTLTVPYVIDAIAAMERMADTFATGEPVEISPIIPEPVGKAVFECTFEWAREHWDLCVDSIFYKTINEHGEPAGYIKVVTTE